MRFFFVVDFLARSGTATAPGMSPCLRPSTVITNYYFPEQMHRSHRAMIRFVRFFSLNCRFEKAVADTAKDFLVQIKVSHFTASPAQQRIQFRIFAKMPGQHDFPTALPGPNGINAELNYRYIQTCFVTCRKSFCVVGAILVRRFQKMRGSFRGRRSVSIVIFRGRRSTLDVLRVFCESHWQGCVKRRQGADFVACVAFCEMC